MDVVQYDPDPRLSAETLQANVWVEVKVKEVTKGEDKEEIKIQLDQPYLVKVKDVVLGFRVGQVPRGKQAKYKQGKYTLLI